MTFLFKSSKLKYNEKSDFFYFWGDKLYNRQHVDSHISLCIQFVVICVLVEVCKDKLASLTKCIWKKMEHIQILSLF